MHTLLVQNTSDVLMASSSSGDSSWLGLLFLLSGPAYFMFMYMRYRNTTKRHFHERETLAEVDRLEEVDRKVKSVTGSTQSKMSGSNHREVRG